MDLKSRMNVVQAKMNGTVAALTYGYMAHMNNAGANIIAIGEDTNAVNSSNIENSACSSEMLRGLVHAFQDSYKGALAVDSTVCDPKYIPWNCVMKDKNGITQRGAAADLFIDYPYATKGRHQFSDGWTDGTISSTSRNWNSVCYGNGKFVAVAINTNYFAYSSDGINWTEGTISDTSRGWISVCYGNGKFVTVANSSNYFAYSTDGINWTEGTISNTNRQWESVCYGNGKFVAVAYNSNYFAYSTDGMNWTESTISSTSRLWFSVCYGNDKYVAVVSDSNTFAYSTDGINWTEGTISSTSRYWGSVCYGNDKFVAVARSSNYFAYSTDGINWTEGTISDTTRQWHSVCYGNKKFVTVAQGSNYFAYSTDGINWTESTISDTSRGWISVCYGNGKFVAVADSSNYFAYIYTGQYDYNLIPSDSIQELPYTDITHNSIITGNQSDIDAGLITFNYNDNISICGAIPFGSIVAPQILKDAIQASQINFIIKKYEYTNEYRNDQFYRYLTFTNNGTSYIGITNDMMHFTVYNITGSYAFRDGVILMHIPEKDAVAMITRHPINTIVNVIDGNDPENMTDYDKPYYRLIELPFLKKYYKYNGKHVRNVKLGISTYIDSNPSTYRPLTDNTLIITVFNKVYSIGIPNWVSDNLNAQNNKCFNSTFKADSTDSDAIIGIEKSTIFTTYGNNDNNVIADCITTRNLRNRSVMSILNYDFDNPEYDKPADESAISMANMMRYQYNDLNDTTEPDNVIYPVTTYFIDNGN